MIIVMVCDANANYTALYPRIVTTHILPFGNASTYSTDFQTFSKGTCTEYDSQSLETVPNPIQVAQKSTPRKYRSSYSVKIFVGVIFYKTFRIF